MIEYLYIVEKHIYYANIRIQIRMLIGLYNEEVDDFEMVRSNTELSQQVDII